MRSESEQMAARRAFLTKCGKFALATPPAMTLLLSTTGKSFATISSGGFEVPDKRYLRTRRRRPQPPPQRQTRKGPSVPDEEPVV